MDDITFRQFYYDMNENVMIDEDGFIVFDIFKYIWPSMLFLFKSKGEYMLLNGRNGEAIELIYPEEDEEVAFYNYTINPKNNS